MKLNVWQSQITGQITHAEPNTLCPTVDMRFLGTVEVNEPGEKKEHWTVWVNIYRQSDGSLASSHPFPSEHIAMRECWPNAGALGTFPVHIVEKARTQ